MPVDLALSTNTPAATFELRQAQSFGDNGLVAAFLVVRSGAFAAALPYVVTRRELVSFADAIDVLEVAEGAAHLRAHGSEDELRFEGGAGAPLRISGDLRDPEEDQRLKFSFIARWDGVASLVDGLRQLIADTA